MPTEETRILTAVFITAIVLGVIIGYFVWSIIRQHRRAMLLQQQLLLAEMETLEKERARTASDLHDELAPLLSVIKFRVDYAKHKDEELSIASRQLDGLIDRIREIASNLMPQALHTKGLCTALKEFTGTIQQASGLKIYLDCEELPELQHDKRIHVYRIIQECVHNVVKHAAATELNILFRLERKYLNITCRDNGKGFNADVSYPGMGLHNLRRRTDILGGRLNIASKAGEGTNLLFEFPETNLEPNEPTGKINHG